ncbi:hypothetical protein T492DRAFT_1114533 [Pavlovales sp. CCMP2436]|nr:hypothetical protein T492DRAFT_1114533 [Pavlovales sp. CCMP2436]
MQDEPPEDSDEEPYDELPLARLDVRMGLSERQLATVLTEVAHMIHNDPSCLALDGENDIEIACNFFPRAVGFGTLAYELGNVKALRQLMLNHDAEDAAGGRREDSGSPSRLAMALRRQPVGAARSSALDGQSAGPPLAWSVFVHKLSDFVASPRVKTATAAFNARCSSELASLKAHAARYRTLERVLVFEPPASDTQGIGTLAWWYYGAWLINWNWADTAPWPDRLRGNGHLWISDARRKLERRFNTLAEAIDSLASCRWVVVKLWRMVVGRPVEKWPGNWVMKQGEPSGKTAFYCLMASLLKPAPIVQQSLLPLLSSSDRVGAGLAGLPIRTLALDIIIKVNKDAQVCTREERDRQAALLGLFELRGDERPGEAADAHSSPGGRGVAYSLEGVWELWN